MPINIPIAADSRQFLNATTDMAKGLDGVADALDDVTADSQKGTDKLESGFKDAQRQSEKTEKSFKDLARTVERESKDAGKAIDKNIGDGLDKAESGMGDFKDEAAGTAREGAASFSGEFSDVGDAIQETLANALSGFGPAGAAAGIALAIGFGALKAQIEKDTEASKERVQSMYDAMIESQGRFLTDSAIMSQVKSITDNTDEMAKAQEIAAGSGVELGIVLRAMAGDASAAAEVQAELQKKLDDAAETAKTAADENRGLTSAEEEAALAAGKAADALGAYGDEMDLASDKYDAYAAAARYANNEMQDAAAKADGLRDAIVKLPDGKTITLRVDDDFDGASARFERALAAMRQKASKGISVDYQITRNGSKVY